MKRFFAFLMMAGVMLGASQSVVAQQRGEWSIKGGVGWFSLPDVVGGLLVGFGSIDSTNGVVISSFVPMCNPNIEVQYAVNNWLALGGSVAVGYASAKSVFSETGVVNKSAEALYPTLCISAQTRYFSSGKFAMYGSWGAGVMALISSQKTTESSNDQMGITSMINLYPLSLSYGGDLGGFLEAGWGAKGFVNLGVYYNF